MRTNVTKEKLRRGELVLGCAMQHFRTPEVARLFAAAGFDYVFLDGEHSGFDLETLQDVIAAAARAGITPIVRPAELLYSLTARLLDVGAQGVILPRVEDPKLLQEAVSWTRFPPLGKRGFGMMAPVLDYEPRGMPEIVEHCNANTLVVTQFESRLALERADELLSIEGVDVALVGPADLSIALGIPGQFDHPLLVETVTRLIEQCQEHGVASGIHLRDVGLALPWVARGMRFISVGSEHSLLLEKSQEVVHRMRDTSGR